jgi:hypothetical protein
MGQGEREQDCRNQLDVGNGSRHRYEAGTAGESG